MLELDKVPGTIGPPPFTCAPAVAVVVGLPAVAVGLRAWVGTLVGVIPGGEVSVGVTFGGMVTVGVRPGVEVSVGVGVGVETPVGVIAAVGVTPTVGEVVGVMAGRVGDGEGAMVTVTTGVTVGREAGRVGAGVGVLLFFPSVGWTPLPVLAVRVSPTVTTGETPPGVLVPIQGVTTRTGVESGVTVACATPVVVEDVLPANGKPGWTRRENEPQTLPTVTKSRDIPMLMLIKMRSAATRRPPLPRFHRAITVSIIFSYPPPVYACRPNKPVITPLRLTG